MVKEIIAVLVGAIIASILVVNVANYMDNQEIQEKLHPQSQTQVDQENAMWIEMYTMHRIDAK